VLELHAQTRALIRRLFALRDVAEAERMLVSVLAHDALPLPRDGGQTAHRICCAAVRVSHGELTELAQALELAHTDWRDLLLAADFADDIEAHLHWMPEQERAKS
jgi:hypothetical protein